jgi:uncharacterized protein YigE (DUF2233 family)
MSFIGFLLYIPVDQRIPLLRSVYNSGSELFVPLPRLALIVPKNLNILSMSIADFETVVRQRTGVLDLITSDDVDGNNVRAKAVIKFYVEDLQDGLRVSTTLSSISGQVIGSNGELLQKRFIADGAPFIIDGLLYNLDVNWNTYTAEQSRHRCSAAAFAMFEAAQRTRVQNRPRGIELLKKAVEIDPHFATGYWALGTLLKEDGQTDEADKALASARNIDPEVPQLLDVDPTEAITRALKSAQWKEVEPGLWGISIIQTDYDVGLWAWRFDLSRFSFKLAEQDHELGEGIQWLRAQRDAVLAVNGGFFEKDPVGRLSASGLLIVEGVTRNQPWRERRGGVLAISRDGHLSIVPAREYPFSNLNALYAIQSKPILIEPGGKFVMQSNDHDMQHRAAICLLSNNQAVVIVIDRLGLSLYELGSILLPGNSGHIFDCDSAISLDGGPSTQAYFEPQNVEIKGGWNIHDALIVKRVINERAAAH